MRDGPFIVASLVRARGLVSLVCPATPRTVTCLVSTGTVTGDGVSEGWWGSVFAESRDDEQIIARVAALDIGKAEIVCCIRLPAVDGGRRVQEMSTHSTMVTSLCELANRLVGLGVERVVMEATSDYWRPPFYLFEAHGLEPWLVNAKDVKHLPGQDRPAGRGVAVQGRRAADAAAQLRPTR